MKKLFDSKQKVVIAGLVGLLALLVAVFAGVTVFYASHALPGTSIAGQSISGMTREQATEGINAQIAQESVVLEGEVTPATFALADIGIQVDVEKTVDEAFAPNRGLITRVSGLFDSRDIEPVVTVDEKQLEVAVGGLEGDSVREAANGQVTFDADQQVFVAGASESGSEVDLDALADQVTRAAKAMSFTPIAVSVVEVAPEYDSAVVSAAADQANQWLQTELALLDREEIRHDADVPTKASWVVFEAKDQSLAATLDPTLVKAWVDEHSAETNVASEPMVQNVNAQGTVLSTAREGADGYVANNGQALADAIVQTMGFTEPFVGVIEYVVEPRATEQRLIAPGAENLAYQAAPGEKWIDINLSAHTVTAYEGATPVLSSPMVSGAPATPTVTGEYSVWAKVPTQTMRGNNADGTKYETENVPWILYFHGGYATHGAYWRSSFGYDAGSAGSHGCVNMPVSSARDLYNWANVGTKVISRY